MKYALIIGNNKYNDPKLAQLKTPAADSQALAKILDDQTIGSFDEVTPLINKTETQVRRAISAFLTNKKPDDLILLYFSGHGVLDDRGRLYLALKDTQVDLLKATSIPSSFVADEMDSCRSKRQILILDCCHSGAFARGTKGEQKAITETTFEGSGFGRVVLTASDSTQYALEGDQVIKQTELSLFTHFLLEGLKTGEADTNNDGLIALDEWYDYTYARVISETPRQVPHKWSYNQQGDLLIAKNPYVKKKVAELPYELLHALESSFVGIRESAVNELGNYLRSKDPEMVELAIASLEKMKGDDSRRISSLAERLLSEFKLRRVSSRVAAPSEPATETVPEPSFEAVVHPTPSEPAYSSAATGQSMVEKTNVPTSGSVESERLSSDRTFWLKWSGTTVLGVVLSFILYNYSLSYLSYSFSIPFGIVAGLTSLVQWWTHRDRLESWWIAINTAAGTILGGLHYHFYNSFDAWGHEDFWNLVPLWLIGNFVLGIILMRKTQQKPKSFSPVLPVGSPVELREMEARQNTFFMLLPIFLAFFGLEYLIIVTNDSGLLFLPDWLTNSTWTLYGVLSIAAGLSFFLEKRTPRNFGFVALATFLFLNGMVVELFAFYYSASQPYFFIVPGMMALCAGVFFIAQKETWKSFGYITLSGFLILVGSVYFGIDELIGSLIFSFIAAIFALLASFFFFRRK
jgi:hypothetical protein